jgi:DNA invertase Pin-like site-specific DNA recombinase
VKGSEKAVGYVRASTAGQAASGLGIDAQRDAITAEVERRGWQLLDLIVDAGESGGSLDRPGLREALDLIADGSASVLVVAKLDRLSRSVIDSARILEWIEEADANLVALDLGVDTSTAGGRLVANVLASVAEWERHTISDRTRAALTAKRARGEAISRPTVEPKIRRRIDRQRQRGWTLERIADKLNRDQVPTARGGSEWRPSSVSSALGYRQRSRRRPAELPALDGRQRRQVRAT